MVPTRGSTRTGYRHARAIPVRLCSSHLLGRTLVNILASARPVRGAGLPGLAVPLFYSVVLLLDDGERVRFHGDELETWVGSEPLVPVTPATFAIDPAITFQNQLIVEVELDSVRDLVVILGNRTTLEVGTSYGTTISLGTTGAASGPTSAEISGGK